MCKSAFVFHLNHKNIAISLWVLCNAIVLLIYIYLPQPTKHSFNTYIYTRVSTLTNKRTLWEYQHGNIFHNLCAVNDAYRVSYLYIPKCGSNTLRYLVWNNTAYGNNSQTAPCIHNPQITKRYFKFTFIRDPLYRIISAYTTIISRGNIVYIRNETEYNGVLTPDVIINGSNNMSLWRAHFNQQILFILNELNTYYYEDAHAYDTIMYWNEHIVKITDFLKGNELHFIGCIYGYENETSDMFTKLQNITLQHLRYVYSVTSLESFNIRSLSKRNVHEVNETRLPVNVEDYAHIKHLSQQTKRAIYQFYKDDFELFYNVCVKRLNFDYSYYSSAS